MDADARRVERARSWFQDRVPLDYQAVTYSAADALDTFARFAIAAYEAKTSTHNTHDAACTACFWDCELDHLLNIAESDGDLQ